MDIFFVGGVAVHVLYHTPEVGVGDAGPHPHLLAFTSLFDGGCDGDGDDCGGGDGDDCGGGDGGCSDGGCGDGGCGDGDDSCGDGDDSDGGGCDDGDIMHAGCGGGSNLSQHRGQGHGELDSVQQGQRSVTGS